MRKFVMLCLVVGMLFTTAACSSSQASSAPKSGIINQSKTVSDVLAEGAQTAGSEPAASASAKATAEPSTKAKSSSGKDPAVDLDISVMNPDLTYATINQMMIDPDNFVGKRIKIKGLYNKSADPTTGAIYHFCLIQDATACCAQGLEIVLKGGKYPSADSEFVVTGTFASYVDPNDGQTYYHLNDADIL